jgi:hypothetical protein
MLALTVRYNVVLTQSEETMKPFTRAAVAVFTIVAVVHLIRLTEGWEVTVSGFIVPVWWSAPGFIIAAGLAFMVWHEARG